MDSSSEAEQMTGNGPPVLSVSHLVKEYAVRRRGLFAAHYASLRAVSDVSFDLKQGETLGLVGESGCGKSTLGKCILRLTAPTSGRILFRGADIASIPSKEMRPYRCKLQMVFQDPYASLHPRMRAR